MSYEEVAWGEKAVCDKCGGAGKIDHARCGGTGKIVKPCPELPHTNVAVCPVCQNVGTVDEPCPHCDHGKLPCSKCGGSGKL